MPPSLSPSNFSAMREARLRVAEAARARGSRKLWQYRLHTALLYGFTGILRLMPVDMASAFGGWVGRRIIAPRLPLLHAYQTIRVPFPDMTDADIRQLLADMMENIGRTLAEFVHSNAFVGVRGADRLHLEGLDNLAAARARGKGILLISGHFSNWEMMALAIRQAGLDGAVVVQNPNNPYVLEWLVKRRYRFGLSEQIAVGRNMMARMRAALSRGEAVAMLADQGVVSGVAVPFFGQPVLTNIVPARLALKLDVPLVMMSIRRLAGAHFDVSFSPPLEISRTGDRAADELALMTEVNRFFETQIRANPAGWLWGHPRWAYGDGSRPAPEPSGEDF